VTVHVTDSFSNNVPGVSVTMTINSGTGTLSGTTVLSSDGSGIATFSNLSINLSGGKTLKAASGALTPAISSSFSISPAAASQLVFTQQPSDATAGVAISPAVKVRATDSFGNNVPGAAVTLGLNGGGTLSGSNPQSTDANGVATFSNLSINLA